MRLLLYISIFFISFLTAEVKYIAPLSDQWVGVILDYMDETDKRIYSMNKNFWDSHMPAWKNYDKGESIEWVKIKTMSKQWKEDYGKLSRHHLFLADTKSYSIHSDGETFQPEKAICWVSSAGDRSWKNSPIRSEFKFQVQHTAFLKLPGKMKEGQAYEIKMNNGSLVSFVFGMKSSPTPSIKVNQEGFYPDSKKYAYLGQWVPDFGPLNFDTVQKFHLVDDQGNSVFEGQVSKRAEDKKVWGQRRNESYSGEIVYQLDFSSFNRQGNYRVFIPEVGISHKFRIGSKALSQAFHTAARGFYYQRCGCELKGIWARKACHTSPVHKCKFADDGIQWKVAKERADRMVHHFDFKAIEQTMDTSFSKVVIGGWHDAADYDKRKYHHQPIWDFLGLYELNSKAFTDGQLSLPESSNKVPDVLDEAFWGLRVWYEAQQKDGGVCGRIEAKAHPNHRGMPENDKLKYALSEADRDSTMHYAASAAWYARLIGKFDDSQKKKFLSSALNAYTWARNPSNKKNRVISLYINDKRAKIKGDIKAEFQDVDERHYFAGMIAAINLYQLTGNEKFKNDLMKIYFPYCFKNFSNPKYHRKFLWSMALFLMSEKGIPKAVQIQVAQLFSQIADKQLHAMDNPYRHTWKHHESRRWGNGLPPIYAAYQAVAWKVLGDKKYRQAALFNLDFHLGGNPMGTVQTTGIGKYSVPAIMDIESREDGIDAPVPGITTFGVIEIPWHFKNNVFRLEAKKGQWVQFLPKKYHSESGDFQGIPLWHQAGANSWYDAVNNEFTVNETMGPLMLALGLLLPDDWSQGFKAKPIEFNRYWFP